MRPFEFHPAQTEQAVFEAFSLSPTARIIAGGTSLIDLMKLDVEQPGRVVDVTALALDTVTIDIGSLYIGATMRNSDLARDPVVMEALPVLSEALLAGASPQLRNLATTGGNVLQRTRCSYFRDVAWACNKRVPGAGCSALDGINRSHAVLGTSAHCIATSPSDMNVALMALGARIHVAGPVAPRVIPIEDFYCLPGATPHVETVLKPDELITKVEIPVEPWFTHSHYTKVRDRASYAFALVSAAVALDVDGDKIRDARIAMGGVGTIPWRSPEAEAALKGKSPNTDTFRAAAEAALADARPHHHNAFKVKLAKATVVRALNELEARR
jgi:xanthine dehydrogenase YagS FAD-binding subunit